MMYNNKLAFAVKVAGKVLREFGETVYLPFGSEYSLVIKNLNNRRACVRITLDGQEVVDGGLIVNANSSVDLERFVKPGQMDKGNRFKFIERTGKVEATRGIQLEDGILRVEFEFEKEYPKYEPTVHHHIYHNRYPLIGSYYSGSVTGSLGSASLGDVQAYASNASFSSTSTGEAKLMNTRSRSLKSAAGGETEVKTSGNQIAGITVPGSVSEQKFVSTNFTGDGTTQVMVMRLFGETETAPVKEAITVKTKPKCTTCGHVNKAKAKFCSECGTGLEIV